MTRQASRHTSSDASGSPLFRMGSWLRRGKAGDDARQIFLEGGREADVFYRQRYSYDKVVRSTHGVNCTGSCSWKVYVKDGIITWESQQTDYPTTGPDMPEYEPRGCPRGAAFSWYEYSPPGSSTPTSARPSSTSTARPAHAWATRCWPGGRSSPIPRSRAPTKPSGDAAA